MAKVSDPEVVWRDALRARGRDWVMAELHRLPGRPGDALYEVVFEEPYPTRDFCLRWCAEEDNRLIRWPWEKMAALVFFILAVVCGVGAVRSWNEPQPSQVAPAVAAMPQGHLGNSDDITAPATAPTAQRPSGYSLSGTSLPSICSYQSYQTAECKTSK